MNHQTQSRRVNWTLLILTIICEVGAYFGALIFRYVILNPLYSNPTREYSFYRFFLIIVVSIRVILFFAREQSKTSAPIWRLESAEIAAIAIKQHVLLLVLLVLVLYFVRWTVRVSRTVMFFLIFLGIIFDTIVRILYKNRHVRKYGVNHSDTNILLVCTEAEETMLKYNLESFGYVDESHGVYQDLKVKDIIDYSQLGRNTLSNIYDGLYISANASGRLTDEQRILIENLEIPIWYGLHSEGLSLSKDMITQCGGYAARKETGLKQKSSVLGVQFTVTTISEAIRYVIHHVDELRGKYICFSNVHTTVSAYEDTDYKNILNNSAFTFPDGKPIAKAIVENRFPEAERVAGPDFMDAMFRLGVEKGLKHYFYGSSQDTIDKLESSLEEKYPGIAIAGMVSPPFRPLSDEEDALAIKRINDSGADFVWVGLGAPKQEKWMSLHAGKINALMLGVGAGFDFHAGTIKRAPVLIQKIGLEWLYRLMQDPKRLFSRYFITNSKFIWYSKVLNRH